MKVRLSREGKACRIRLPSHYPLQDSFTSDEVMTFVHQLSRDGMTICATIHSPSPFTFHLFEVRRDLTLQAIGDRSAADFQISDLSL